MSAGQKGVSTMAILNGIVSKMKGSAGNLTFKHANSQTIVSEKATEVKKVQFS